MLLRRLGTWRNASFYAEGGERFATGSPLIRGTDALRKEWRKYVSSPGTFQWTTSRVEVSSSGDLAYETGNFVRKTVDKNGQPSTTNGKYVCVWKKQNDGKWKVIADIDNPDS
jgi:ketosteroid isomerase-like protein